MWNRDTQSMAWVVAMAALFAAVLALWPSSTSSWTLVLGPDPWSGVVAGLVMAVVAAALPLQWLTRRGRLQHTELGVELRPGNARQRRRVAFAAVVGYVLSVAVWLWFGPGIHVDLVPFLHNFPEVHPIVVTCAEHATIPTDLDWAIGGMCIWNQQRVVPVGVGALLLLGVLGLGWWGHARQRDVLSLQLDGQGLSVGAAGHTRRLPWSQIRGVEFIGKTLVLLLPDDERLCIECRGLASNDIGWLHQRIEESMQPEVTLTDAEQRRIQAVQVLNT